MALLEKIYTYLNDNSFITGDWVCYLDFVPEDANEVIVLTSTGGAPVEQVDTKAQGEATFQVRVRGKQINEANALQEAKAKIEAILIGLNNATISGLTYVYALQSAPLFLGWDDTQRPLYSVNFRVRGYIEDLT